MLHCDLAQCDTELFVVHYTMHRPNRSRQGVATFNTIVSGPLYLELVYISVILQCAKNLCMAVCTMDHLLCSFTF